MTTEREAELLARVEACVSAIADLQLVVGGLLEQLQLGAAHQVGPVAGLQRFREARRRRRQKESHS